MDILTRRRRMWGAGESGAAAVELALVLPMLAVLAAGVIQYGGLIIANQQMHNGVASGALYVMRGGTDTTTVHTIGLASWPNQPSDATLTAVQSCTCAGASASCTSLCSDNTYPLRYITINASGTYHGPMGNIAESASQVVRTQ